MVGFRSHGRCCGQARLIPWTPVNLIAMSLLALALPDVERTTVATLDSFEDVADIFERNLPDQVRHSARPSSLAGCVSGLCLDRSGQKWSSGPSTRA